MSFHNGQDLSAEAKANPQLPIMLVPAMRLVELLHPQPAEQHLPMQSDLKLGTVSNLTDLQLPLVLKVLSSLEVYLLSCPGEFDSLKFPFRCHHHLQAPNAFCRRFHSSSLYRLKFNKLRPATADTNWMSQVIAIAYLCCRKHHRMIVVELQKVITRSGLGCRSHKSLERISSIRRLKITKAIHCSSQICGRNTQW